MWRERYWGAYVFCLVLKLYYDLHRSIFEKFRSKLPDCVCYLVLFIRHANLS